VAALHQEVGCAHPSLDRAKGMLDRLAPLAHLFRMFVEPALHSFENVLVLPSGDPTLLAQWCSGCPCKSVASALC
jgi:hypothetical protein